MTQHFRQVRRSTVIQNAAGQTFSLGGYQADRKQAKSDLFQDDRAENPPQIDRKSTRLNSSHPSISRMPSSA